LLAERAVFPKNEIDLPSGRVVDDVEHPAVSERSRSTSAPGALAGHRIPAPPWFSAGIELDVWEEASGDVASVEATSESCSNDICSSPRGLAPNGGLCELSNRRAQPRSGGDSSERGLRAKQLIVACLGRIRGVAHDRSVAPESSTDLSK
jgi:hypothetical protein